MARPLRIEYPGGVYHLTTRGNAQQPIFWSNMDRDAFLSILIVVVKRFHWLCHAYCLMDNHYHLVIETPEGNLSRGVRQLNGVYTQWFNRTYKRVGHLFQGRYKAIVVEKETHLLELCRYVVLNPVRAGMTNKPEEWAWSSYRATVGLERVPEFLSVEWILGQFARSKRKALELYRAFVEEGVEKASPWKELRGQIFLGGESFVDKLKRYFRGIRALQEIPRQQRYADRPLLGEILKANREGRDRTVYKAHAEFGYTLKEIADFMGVHYTTVSKRVKRVEQIN